MHHKIDRRFGNDLPQVLETGEKHVWSGRPDLLRMARSKAGHALLGAASLVLLGMTPCPEVLGYLPAVPSVSAYLSPRHLVLYAVLVMAAYSLVTPGSAYRRVLGTKMKSPRASARGLFYLYSREE